MASSKRWALRGVGTAVALTFILASPVAAAVKRLPRSTPEEQGISSKTVLDFIEAADAKVNSMHSFMLLRHGKVVAEAWWDPYVPEDRHVLYSLSKSFTSTAVGLAVGEGKLSLDDTVVSFFSDELPESPTDNLKNMRVRDLLSMSTGHHAEDVARFDYASKDATKAFLAIPVPHKPGTHFMYNTRLPRTASLRAPRHREPHMGRERLGDLSGWIRAQHPHRGHRELRAAASSEGRVAGQANRPQEVDRGGHEPSGVQREQPVE
jgi:hypothetical protein